MLTSQIAAGAASRKLIHGLITTRDNRPVAGATVEVCDRRGTEIGRSLTDAAGKFEIVTDAAPGQYELVVILMILGRQQDGAKEFNTFLREAPGDRRVPQIHKILAAIT